MEAASPDDPALLHSTNLREEYKLSPPTVHWQSHPQAQFTPSMLLLPHTSEPLPLPPPPTSTRFYWTMLSLLQTEEPASLPTPPETCSTLRELPNSPPLPHQPTASSSPSKAANQSGQPPQHSALLFHTLTEQSPAPTASAPQQPTAPWLLSSPPTPTPSMLLLLHTWEPSLLHPQ